MKRNSYKFNGIFDEAVRFIEEFQLLNVDLWKRFVHQFKEDADYEGGWRGEYWGKMMRGACMVYAYSENPALYQVLTDSVRDILTAQDEVGRISSYGINHEFDAWDLWCRKYVLLGMQHYLEICKDTDLSDLIVKSMCRQLEYIISKIGPREEGKLPITKATRHWRGLNSSSLLEPVVKLYHITQNKRYLEFATYIVNCGGTDVVNIFELAYENKMYPYQYPVTKAYEMISCFEGLLEYYYATGEEKYKICIVNFANKLLESDFTIVGGCGCTHEFFDHSSVRQANTNNGVTMQETCVTVTLMKFLYRLTLLTGERRYVDAFERSFYNAYWGAINFEKVIDSSIMEIHPKSVLEPLPFDSYSPLTTGTRGHGIGGLRLMSDNHYYGCCACIGSAGLGVVPQITLLNDPKGVTLNLFIDGQIQTLTPAGNNLEIRIETNYPVSGNIKIVFETVPKETFEFKIRIPAWSKQTSLYVNGMPTSVSEDYAKLYKEWISGDYIDLILDMRTEYIRPIPYGQQILMNQAIKGLNYMIPTYDEEDVLAKNHCALRRGPIILAQDARLGYDLDCPAKIVTDEEHYVDVSFPNQGIAPYRNILELEVSLSDGRIMRVTDYASAGKLWSDESKIAAWILTE